MAKSVLWTTVALAGLCIASSAHAGDKPEFAAPDSWVRPQTLPDTKPTSDAASAVMMDEQVHFGDDEDVYYTEVALRIQTPQGLAIGRPYIYWNPESDRIVVHKVHILRDGKVIDVLAAGQTFTVLRREANLDSSMLDGMLTGVLQPEGLQVGDIIDYAFSIHRHDPVLQSHSEFRFSMQPQITIGRISHRVVWPATKTIRWQVSDDIKDAKLSKTPLGSEWTLELKDYKAPTAPLRAPDRFTRTGQLTFTQFTSWRDLSAMMGPLYDKATTLAPESPLRAEAETIRRLSDDPKVQAAAALRLVEDKVRYVFVATNNAGLVPADADVTWARRFGDCKGKSVLLLALLRQLGIDADAVSVSTKNGDGLDQSLPVLEAFDHVIVRAKIAGQVYWMDGTRQGDGALDTLPVPDYKWALPMRSGAGMDLEAMTVPAPDKPLTETLIQLDASAGLDVPAAVHLEYTVRGDLARQTHTMFATKTQEELEKDLKDYAADDYDWESVDKVSQTFDETTGEQHITLDGKVNLDWSSPGMGKPRRYAADGIGIGGAYEPDRKDAIRPDAPVTLYYPRYERTLETLVLPHGGKGFSVAGETIDKTLGGYVMKRSFSLKNGVFTLDSSEKALQAELPLADFKASMAEMKRIGAVTVYVQAPFDYATTDGDVKSAHAGEPKTAADYIARGSDRADAEQFDDAIADFDAALKLDPTSARAMAMRGNAHAERDETAAALADYDAAVKLDRRDVTAWYGRASLYLKTGDRDAAIAAITRLLDINPADTRARMTRGAIYMLKGERELGLDDALATQMMAPDSSEAAIFLATAYAENNQRPMGADVLRAALKKTPDDISLHRQLAGMLMDCRGLTKTACTSAHVEARGEYDKAIAAAPDADLYIGRAATWDDSERTSALTDLDQALALEPDSADALLTRGQINLAAAAYDPAMADAEAVLAADAKNTSAMALKGSILEARGDIDGLLTQVDAIVATDPDNSVYLNNACWARATHNRDLAKALDLCAASMKLNGRDGATLDSRGLVDLQMADWTAAVDDYSAAMVSDGATASALYGRGIAELRLGRKKEGKADIAAAKKLTADIDKTYAGYGLTQ